MPPLNFEGRCIDTIEGNVNGTNEYDGEVAQRHYTAEDRNQVYGFGRRFPPPPRPQQHRFIPVSWLPAGRKFSVAASS